MARKTVCQRHKKLTGRLQTPVQAPVPAPATESVNIPLPAKTEGIPAAQYVQRMCRIMQPIPTVVSSDKMPRLNLVTDSIEKNSLLGGVATALIVATEFAKKGNRSAPYHTKCTSRPAGLSEYSCLKQFNSA